MIFLQNGNQFRSAIGFGQAAFVRAARHQHHTDGNALAVRHGKLTAPFHRVPQGVAEVQKSAQPQIALIFFHNIALKSHTARNDGFNLLFCFVVLQKGEKFAAENRAVFNDLCHTVGENFVRKRGQRLRVTKHRARLVKCADQIFARRQIHRRFAADRRIHARKKRCRDLHKVNPALIGCRREPCHIADDATAQCDNTIGARDVLFG